MALIDGVGFTSNAAGLKGVLTAADEFCQYRTLWKAAVVCLHRLRRSMQLYLPEGEPDVHRAFLRRYTRTTQVHRGCLDAVPPGAVPAGDAFLLTTES